MWTMLAGLPNKMKTMLDRLTSARAIKIDNVDAAISTRAPASTALSTAVWTNGHAAKIDAFPSQFILESPPIAAGWHVNTVTGGGNHGVNTGNTIQLVTNGQKVVTALGTWVEAFSVTGKGLLNLIAIGSTGGTATACYYRLYVDGVLIATDETTSHTNWRPAVGAFAIDSGTATAGGVAFDQIPFAVSWKLDIRAATTGAGREVACIVRYRRVA